MKRIIYWVLMILAGGVYSGCGENEIELYNQTSRINLNAPTDVISLTDKDYLDEDPYTEYEIRVNLQGDLLKENRDFCLKTTPNSDYKNSLEVVFESKYTYSALEEVSQVVKCKVKRPAVKSGKKEYGCNIEFDLDNPLHQFDKGLVERNRMVLNVRWELEPTGWSGVWGKYSDAKYMFMMDTLKLTLKDITDNNAALSTVKEAYTEYKKTHDPILDDKGEEISFGE